MTDGQTVLKTNVYLLNRITISDRFIQALRQQRIYFDQNATEWQNFVSGGHIFRAISVRTVSNIFQKLVNNNNNNNNVYLIKRPY